MTPSRTDRPAPLRRMRGFTLIELMVTIAIIGILARIALPAYMNYVTRGKLVAMTNTLAGQRTAMEQFYQDNRQYTTVGSGTSAISSPCGTIAYTNYSLTCSATSSTYTLTATGSAGSISGAAYTVTNSNGMATTSFPTAWGGTTTLPANASSCWLMRKGDSC